MKFALISSDPHNAVQFKINPEQGDATSFMNWVDVWKGYHFFYEDVKKDMSFLKEYDDVMMSGNPYYMTLITDIAKFLKDSNTVTIYYPEGSLQLYDNSINGFHKEYYDTWNACDVVSSAEEDKIPYYKSFIRGDTIVRFIHVPLREQMESGEFFIPISNKDKKTCVIYGDNNPNHPMVALACAAKLGINVIGVDIDRGKMDAIKNYFPNTSFKLYDKLPTYPFLRILGRTAIHFYPTEWIGTARQQISCAVSGTICIGNRDSHTQKRLFPGLGYDIYDIDGMVSIAKSILQNDNLYHYLSVEAFNSAKFYSEGNTKARFEEAVESARKIKRSRILV